MIATTKKKLAQVSKAKSGKDAAPIKLKTWTELREYLAKHLTPVRHGPKGQPIYAQKDLETLNIILPDQD